MTLMKLGVSSLTADINGIFPYMSILFALSDLSAAESTMGA